MKRSLPFLFAFCLLFATIGVYFGKRQASPPASGAALFAQTLPDTMGRAQPLRQWQGKSLLINFWAPWCAPCVQEMPELSRLQAELTKKNIYLLGIGVDSAAQIQAFSAQHPVLYPLYIAGMQGITLSEQLGNRAGGLPYTIWLDATGNIKKTYSGRIPFEELRRDLSLP